MYDQHIHSRYSQDGHHDIMEIAQAAVERGLRGITITDHFDLCDAEIGYRFYLDCEQQRRRAFGKHLTAGWRSAGASRWGTLISCRR